jgi:hypothetical protein
MQMTVISPRTSPDCVSVSIRRSNGAVCLNMYAALPEAYRYSSCALGGNNLANEALREAHTWVSAGCGGGGGDGGGGGGGSCRVRLFECPTGCRALRRSWRFPSRGSGLPRT